MLFRAAYIAFHLAFVHGAPSPLPVATVVTASLGGIDPAVMAGYLVSGHPGARYSGQCGDHGKTCGPFRLHELWAVRYGLPLDARGEAWPSAYLAMRLHRYAMWTHWERCERRGRVRVDHEWGAHLKASTGRRGSPEARAKLARQRRAERDMCPEPWCSLLRLLP